MRIIAHIDMDAFFAAIEERDHKKFQGLPVVVGSDPKEGRGRGVVSTANYKARKYGIHSALPISRAWQLSERAKREGKPEVIFVEPHFKKYAEVSRSVAGIVRKYAERVEETSIDESYFDLSFAGSYKKAEEIAKKLKREINDKEKLTASVGIGPNKLVAKIASDFQKPDGLTIVRENEAESFLSPLPVRKIPGIGPKTETFLRGKNIFTVSDLKKLSKLELEEMFGKWGAEMFERARGRDDSEITEEYEIKSVGEQETFEEDTLDFDFIVRMIRKMCRNIIGRLAEEGFSDFRTVVLTVRFADFETKTRSHTLKKPTQSLRELEFEAIKLLMPFTDRRENPRRRLIRLVGVRIEKLA